MNFRQICPLTTGIDNTTGANTVKGVIDQAGVAGNTTWGLSDTVSTVAGGTVELTLLSNATGGAAGYSTTGVTTMNIRGVDQASTAVANSFDLNGFTGLTKVSVANSSVIGTTADTLSLNSVKSTTAVGLTANGQYQNVTVNGADWTGAADTLSLTVEGRSGALNLLTGIETLSVTSTGTDARLASLNSLTTATNKTVTVAGESLRIDAVLDSTITSFDASKSTGPVNVFLAPGSTLTSAKGGTGTADVLAVNALGTTQTISGFEKIQAQASGTYNLVNVTGVTKVGVDAIVSGTIAATFTNAPATVNTIEISGGAQRTTLPTATNVLATGAVSLTPAIVTGTSDAITLALSNGGVASTGTLTLGGVTVSGVETVAVTAADFAPATATPLATNITLGGLNVNAITALAIASVTASGPSNINFGAIDISSAPNTTTSTINFGGMTGNTTATLNAGVVNNLTYTGGLGIDTITNTAVAATKTHTYNLGAGNDVFTFLDVAAATSVLNIDGGAGDDTFNAATYTVGTSASSSLDGGAGTADSLVFAAGVSMVGLKNIVNIEKIQAQVTGAIVDGGAVSGDTIEVTNFAATTGRLQVTADAAGATVNLANFTFIGANSGAIVNGGAGIDAITGTSTADTITGLASADTIVDGTGVDVISSGAGADTITLSTDSAADVIVFGNSGTVTGDADLAFGSLAGSDTITGFTGGAGGDDLRFDVSGFGLAGSTEYVGLIGALTVDSSDEIVVLTAVGYATDEAAEDAVAARVTTDGLDMVIIYFNTGDSKAHIIHDTDAGVDGASTTTLVGTVNVTGSVVGGMATDFTAAANISSFA